MTRIMAVPAWALIFTVMACYMQDSKLQAQVHLALPITER